MTVVLSILVKVTVVLILALVAVRRLRGAPASMRHLILASALGVVAVMPLAERTLPALTIPFATQQAAAQPLLPIVTIPDMTSRESTPALASASTPLSASGREDRSSAPSMTTLLAAAWMIGAIVCLVPVLLTPWHLRRLRTASRPWRKGDALARTVAGEIASRPVTLFVNDSVTAPLTCGLVRPTVVLPADAMQWPDDEVRRALVHELEHVRRADWCVHVATRVVCAIYWFHPLVWAAWRQLSLESERACDDEVLRVSDRTAYAQQLVTLARRQTQPSTLPVLSMVEQSDLSTRVAALLDGTQARGRLGPVRALATGAAACLLVAGVAPLRAASQAAQIPSAQSAAVPAFDVVSIKENRSGEMGQRINRQPGGRIITSNYSVRALLLFSYGLQPQQLIGGPDWIDSARYDITAQASGEFPITEPGTVGPPQLMMQRMLAERFQLGVHTETRELPIYALTLARRDGRLGPRIATAAIDCQTALTEAMKKAQSGGGPPQSPQRAGGGPGCGMTFDGRRVTAGGMSMEALARSLAGQVGRLVINRTGLMGGFDFDLEFAPDPTMIPAGAQLPPPDANAPSIFTALEEQLGLRLEATRGPVEVLVIDRVERPTEN